MFSAGPELFEEDNGNRLMVDECLLVIGQTNVYAIGDCCNTKVYIYSYSKEITDGNIFSLNIDFNRYTVILFLL